MPLAIPHQSVVCACSNAPAAADDSLVLATVDIFAGCGGLSEGLYRAGAARTKWAIEYEAPAAEAFKINNPDAVTWCCNCNVLLTAAMTKAGAADFCAPLRRCAAMEIPCVGTCFPCWNTVLKSTLVFC